MKLVPAALLAYLQSFAAVAGHRGAAELTYHLTGRLRLYAFNADELQAFAVYSALSKGVN